MKDLGPSPKSTINKPFVFEFSPVHADKLQIGIVRLLPSLADLIQPPLHHFYPVFERFLSAFECCGHFGYLFRFVSNKLGVRPTGVIIAISIAGIGND